MWTILNFWKQLDISITCQNLTWIVFFEVMKRHMQLSRVGQSTLVTHHCPLVAFLSQCEACRGNMPELLVGKKANICFQNCFMLLQSFVKISIFAWILYALLSSIIDFYDLHLLGFSWLSKIYLNGIYGSIYSTLSKITL